MEHPTSNKDINAIKDVRRLLNDVRDNLLNNETKRIRRKLYKKEAVSHFFKEREDDDIITDRQKNVLKNIARYIKNISTHLKNLKKDQTKQNNQYRLDYLFNKDSKTHASLFKDARDLLNECKSSLSLGKINETRKELFKKETVYNALKAKEQNDSLTDVEKKVLKRINRYHKDFKKDLDKLQKYQHNITYGLDYFSNEKDDYYKPKEDKKVLDGGYILYESMRDTDGRLSIDKYFNIIKPYLKDLIDDHKPKDEWKIQLSMQIIFVSFTDANKTHEMYSKCDNIIIKKSAETEDIANELFNTFFKRYQEGLETKMRRSSFTFDRINLLKYYLHKISLNRGSSYIKSPEWIKNKGVTINPKNTKDNNCFQYAIIDVLNYHNIDNHPEKISNLRPFINNYNWKDIEFPANSKDKFECNNKTIALNVLYVPYNAKQEINNDDEYDGTNISKHNNKRVTQVNLLMIAIADNNWHYLAVKRIPGLLRGIT